MIPVPEILKYEFNDADKFMILASDGVWEFISSQVLLIFNLNSHENGRFVDSMIYFQEAVDIVHSNISMGAHFACQELIQAAALRWHEEEGNYRDDVSFK